MRYQELSRIGLAVLVFGLSACTGNYSGTTTGSQSADPTGAKATNPKDFFAVSVAPNMNTCRSCHVPDGSADTDKGKRFMLSGNSSEDYAKLQASWTTLGKGVETNRILLKASNTDPEPHSAGALWPKGEAQYNNIKLLFACWDDPAGCAELLAGGSANPSELPLLGNLQANGGRNYAAVFCEGKDDGELLPKDPRELIAGDNLNNSKYSVWYNDPFEICETDALFENQKRQNELLKAQGKKPVYSAHRRPKTCGEWRTAVDNGRKYIMKNAITGEVLTRDSIYSLATYLGFSLDTEPAQANALLAKVARERYGWPKHPYDNPFPLPSEDPNAPGKNGGSLQLPIALVQTKDDNGKWTGKVGVTCYACHVGQIGTGEVLGNSAKPAGKNAALGNHPELYGGSADGTFVSINGSNTDTGLAMYDVERANNTLGFGPNDFGTPLNTPGYMAARTRGTNAADQEIVNVLVGRDLDSLNWRGELPMAELLFRAVPSAPMMGGDQDMPTWWWTHNKSRYLWVGFGSAGSSRGNYFPSSTNPNDGHWSKAREGDYQDLDMWLNSIEAPAWPDGYCSNADGSRTEGDKPHCISKPLAEAGAILFHSKDLWADSGNDAIPRPPVGNGSCAGCHGAYSPRYINKPGFLPDPSLAGMSGATVPLDILGTDPAQSDLFNGFSSYRTAFNDGISGGIPAAKTKQGSSAKAAGPSLPNGPGVGVLNLGASWFSYPDAVEGYRLPEEKTQFEEASDDGKGVVGSCAVGTKGGYTAQPLHGVWASAPYFHNGSVPTVWDVLKPSDRPDVWWRQRVPESEASPVTGDRGFDTNMTRAYDYGNLGWSYESLDCGMRMTMNAYGCQADQVAPYPYSVMLTPFKVIADYFSPPYVATPKEATVGERGIFNTHAFSKGKQGHEFTQVLTDQERRALIEYLKTL